MIATELRTQFLRMRTFVLFGLMIALPTVMTIALALAGPPGHARKRGLMDLATRSGLNLPLAALSAMSTFLMPIVVVVFAGSAIAEEASWGTLRYLLVRPISRNRLLTTKLAVTSLLGIAAIALAVAIGLGEGVAAFGWHPVQTPSSDVFSAGNAAWRLVVGALYVAWSMSGILAIGLFLSTVTDSTMGAVSGAFGVAIVSEILDAISALKNVRSFLPTHYWHAWEGLFMRPETTGDIVRGILLQLPYVVIFLSLAWWWFNHKDVTA